MACESEAYLVEDCVPLADLDKTVGSEGTDPVQRVLDGACTNLSAELPTVVHTGTNSKVRKLIIKTKSGKEPVLGSTPVQDDSKPKGCKLRIKLKPPKESGSADVGLGGDDVTGVVRDDHSDGRKKKKKEKGENRRRKAEKGEVKTQVRKRGRKRTRDDEDAEINEMWEAVIGGNSEDDKDGARTVNEEDLPRRAYKGKEKIDSEIEELFRFGRKKKKQTDSGRSLTLVETVIAELDVAAEEDFWLNTREKPAITKLRNLSLLTDIIPRKHLQQEFIDRGGLSALRKWIELLPDGSLPNITLRGAVFKCLNDLSIDLGKEEIRELIKSCGIGRAIKFYHSRTDETRENKRLLKELVEKWHRVLLNISTSYEDMRNFQVERTYKRPPPKKATSNAAAGGSKDNDLDIPGLSLEKITEPSSSKRHASRPEPVPLDFMVRPPSKVDPEAVRAQAKRTVKDQNSHRAKLSKKLEKMGAPKKRQLQAMKLSAEGRGMVKHVQSQLVLPFIFSGR